MGQGAWRLIQDPPQGAAWNMAVDEALLLAACQGRPVLRLYGWSRPAVSLGYRQGVPTWIERCTALGVEAVRRISGGGTVVHDGDLTYAVVAPRPTPGLPEDLRGSCNWIREVLIQGLRAAGLDARPSRPAADAGRAELCFAAATGTEIDVNQTKLVGSAQRRTSWAFLQHGSVRLRDDSRLYRALLGETPGPSPRGLACAPGEVARALAEAFRGALAGALEPDCLRVSEQRLARERLAGRSRAPLAVPAFSSSSLAACADRLP